MEKILVFIPAYNCAAQIGRVLAQLEGWVAQHIDGVLVVDNVSRDDTVEKATAAAVNLPGTDVVILRNAQNVGYGGSVKVAIDYALQHGFGYLLVLHGDDQADIRDFAQVLESRSYHRTDLTMGARFHPHSRLAGYSGFRLYGNKFLNLLCSLCAMRRIYDLGSGLNIYKLSSLSQLPYAGFPDDLTFDPQLLCAAMNRGFCIDYVPISWREEDQKSNAKIFHQGVHIMKIFLLHRLWSLTGKVYA